MSNRDKQQDLKDYGIQLTAVEIHGKEFSTRMRGYDVDEVNLFLDQIIKDYQAFDQVIAKLQKENRELKRLAKAQSQPASVSTFPNAVQEQQPAQIEELLNRIRDLEFHCWGRTKG